MQAVRANLFDKGCRIPRKEMRMWMQKVTAGISGALLLAAPAWAQTLPQPPALMPVPPAGTRLELQARGVVRVVPDLVVVSAGVVTQAPDANGALRANASRMEKVVAALRAAGIADKDLRTQSVNLSPQYRYAENVPPAIVGYQASNVVAVQFRDIAKSGAVLDVLAKQGANEINGPSFEVAHRAAAEDNARRDAVRQLQDRAALYAQMTGLAVRRVVSISETGDSPPSPTPMLMARAAGNLADAKTAILPGEQEIGISVSAVFELGPR